MPKLILPRKIRKRDGSVVPFEKEKIRYAVERAAFEVLQDRLKSITVSETVTDTVLADASRLYRKATPGRRGHPGPRRAGPHEGGLRSHRPGLHPLPRAPCGDAPGQGGPGSQGRSQVPHQRHGSLEEALPHQGRRAQHHRNAGRAFATGGAPRGPGGEEFQIGRLGHRGRRNLL